MCGNYFFEERAAGSPAVLRLLLCMGTALLDSPRVLRMSRRPEGRDGGEVTNLLRAWSEKLGGCRCGEGMPCTCNTIEDPEIRVVIVEADTTWH